MKLNSAGIAIIGLIVLGALVYGGFYLLNSVIPDPVEPPQTTEITETGSDSTESESTARRARLVAVDGLSGSGSATIEQNFAEYTIFISAALPELEDGGYYEAYIDGPSKIFLGRPQKDGPTWRLTYTVAQDLSLHDSVEIVVDGPRDLQNQPRPLPFTILSGQFQ